MLQKKEQKKLKEVALLHGSHMAMRLATERAILGHVCKPSGKSTNHALQLHMGLYDDLSVQDWLNDPYSSPDFVNEDSRTALEAKYSIA